MLKAANWNLNGTAQEAYLAVCAGAADAALLGAFKRDPAYRCVLEHVTEAQGRAYLEVILQDNPQLMRYSKLFQENDRYGAPFTFNYDGRVFSPTTLRYVKVASDLVDLFGSLDDLEIIEIGAGYGGQCKIVADLFTYRSYTLVDLPAVGKLQDRYLSLLGVRDWRCLTPSQIDVREYDLVISNYALSELDEEGQRFYAESVLCQCRRGYITWNSAKPFDAFGHPLIVQVGEERPQTGRANRLITWGTRSPKAQASTCVVGELKH